MTKVKICGIKSFRDVDYVNRLLPDYIGFVFAPSKRQVSIDAAKNLKMKLDKRIKIVGVFVNEESSKVRNIAKILELDILQFHGTEDEIYIENFKDYIVWKSIGISVFDENNIMISQKKIDSINNSSVEGILMDSSIKGISGGSGESFDWNIIKNLKIDKSIILAGGLDSENITRAIKIVRPYAVDVSSGVEKDGVKRFEKISKFIERVRILK